MLRALRRAPSSARNNGRIVVRAGRTCSLRGRAVYPLVKKIRAPRSARLTLAAEARL
jgi:hypothetical protein